METSTTEETNQKSSKLSCLREKLGQKAKKEPKFRFYSLYGHLLRKDVLEEAWQRVKRNGGSPGIDQMTIQDIESTEGGSNKLLDEIRRNLEKKTYRPSPIKRVYIPKSNGKLRPLGIPIIRDRVVQTALLLILEPIFEADFLDCSYGFRPNRSAHLALEQARKLVNQGKTSIYDADLKGYFDTIPHDKLMKAIEMRISDRHVLKLIKMWLETPIAEDNGNYVKPNKGTPQGGIISPLLANIYLHWFDKVFTIKSKLIQRAKAVIIRYADDLVVLSEDISPQLLNFIEEKLEKWMGLEINREKTKIVDLSKDREELHFLGYTIRYILSARFHKRYCHLAPSKKSVYRAQQKVKEMTAPKYICVPLQDVINRVGRFQIGWGSYFNLGYPSKSFRRLNCYISRRLIRHIKRRSQKGYRTKGKNSWHNLLVNLGYRPLTKKLLGSYA